MKVKTKNIKLNSKIILYTQIGLIATIFVILTATSINCFDKALATKIVVVILFLLTGIWI